MQIYRNPDLTRGCLTIQFFIGRSTARISEDPSFFLRWFVRAPGRFTNFRAVQLHVENRGVLNRNFDVIEYFKFALEPVRGFAENNSRTKNSALFHPLDH